MRLLVVLLCTLMLSACAHLQEDEDLNGEPPPGEQQTPTSDTSDDLATSHVTPRPVQDNDSDDPEETPLADASIEGTESLEDDSLCDPPLRILPCPRTFTDDELRATVGDAISWMFDAGFDEELVEQDNHPFLSEPYPNYDSLRSGGWAFATQSQVFACIGVRPNSPAMFPERLQGQLVCYHTILPPGAGQSIVFFPCDRLEPGGYLCWRESDAAPETSYHAMACTSLPFLREYLEPGDYVGFYAECAPITVY